MGEQREEKNPKKRICMGLLAHVDAGKTTFSEQLLYHTHSIQKLGRVDHKNSFLDTHEIERNRGITIFSDQAVFQYQNSEYYLIDTPGHIDFSAEMERVLQVLDYAVILISCVEGIQGHTQTIWNLLRKHQIPTFFFFNKIDRTGADVFRVLSEVRQKLTPNICYVTGNLSGKEMSQALAEEIAQQNDILLEEYLTNGYQPDIWLQTAKQAILDGELFPCMSGSALQDIGIQEFLESFDLLTDTTYHTVEQQPFAGRVYKVRHDGQNNRIVYIKVLQGQLRVKNFVDTFSNNQITTEKINEIRIYNGTKYHQVTMVSSGNICAVTGLSTVKPGDSIGKQLKQTVCEAVPMLISKVLYPTEIHPKTMLKYLQILEDEEPMLEVSWSELFQEIQVKIMGKMQLEILQEVILERFGIQVCFGECRILYRETIVSPIYGYGHFEPLRHYAEVHLHLSPAKRGSGIQFQSHCSTDILGQQIQNLIRTHVFEKQHKGILLGMPLTDVMITLLNGRAHIKHTEGGDFREAVYRAIRQGLEQADNLILEPYYRFEIEVNSNDMGKVLSDIQKRHGCFEPPMIVGERAIIIGRGPVACLMDYPADLIHLTRGTGMIQLSFDGYESCYNPEEVIEQIGYDKVRDLENVSDSVFCSHGSGFVVKWQQVEDYLHCEKVAFEG